MARTSIVACGVSEYGKFVRRSGRPEPMPSLRDGSDPRDPNVWTISLFSAKPICVEFYPRTSPITIARDRTARWARHHAAGQGPSFRKHAERPSRNAGYTTFITLLHDKFLRPTRLISPTGSAGGGDQNNPTRLCVTCPRENSSSHAASASYAVAGWHCRSSSISSHASPRPCGRKQHADTTAGPLWPAGLYPCVPPLPRSATK